MKKIITLIILSIALVSCDKDCEEQKKSITASYAVKIQYVKDNPNPDGIDSRQIGLLEQERDRKISEACD